MKNIMTALATIAALTVGTAAQAAKDAVSVGIQVLTEVEITDTTGNTILERKPLDVATPNQTVIYKITVRNSEPDTAKNVVLNIPISESLTIKPESFTSDLPIKTTFSLDAKNFQAWGDLKVGAADEERQAEPEDISAVKVEIPELPRDEDYYIEYDAVIR